MNAITVQGVTRSTPHRRLCLLQVADIALTAIVLEAGGAEQNPLARLLVSTGWLGLTAMLAFKLTLVCLLFRKAAKVNLVSAVYGAVVVNNLLFVVLYLGSAR